MTSKHLFLSHTITSLLRSTRSSLLSRLAWKLGFSQFLFSPSYPPPTLSLKKRATVHRFVSSKYLVASLVLLSLSWMVRRVTRNVWASLPYWCLEKGEGGQWVCVLPPALGQEAGQENSGPLLLTLPHAQETSEPTPDKNRAGLWRETKCRWDTDCPWRTF